MEAHWLPVSSRVFTFRFTFPVRVTRAVRAAHGTSLTGDTVACLEQTIETKSMKILENTVRREAPGLYRLLLEVATVARAQLSMTSRATRRSKVESWWPTRRFIRISVVLHQFGTTNASEVVSVHFCRWLTRSSLSSRNNGIQPGDRYNPLGWMKYCCIHWIQRIPSAYPGVFVFSFRFSSTWLSPPVERLAGVFLLMHTLASWSCV